MSFNFPNRIFFTGFMAVGKSRIGELTAAALGWKHFDTDALVEKNTGCSISQIFKDDGEAYFRRLEIEAVREVCAMENVVISLGGGTLKNPEAVDMIRNAGTLIGLYADPEVILQRVNRKNTRPLLAEGTDQEKLAKIRSMLEERAPLYNLARFQMESREDVPHHIFTKRIISRLQLESLEPLTVGLGSRSYPIYIHDNLAFHTGALAEKLNCAHEFIIVTDTNIKQHQKSFLASLSAGLGHCRTFFFRPGEKEKNLSSLNRLYTYMLKHRLSRKTTIIAAGGGVTGDMAGFAAATYLRGVRFLQVPTTLLAMVDSSVGGKTGINHRLGKNLIGAFHQPAAVIISTDTLSTLPQAEYLAGLAEVVKYSVIRDRAFFDFLHTHSAAILERNPGILKEIIRKCCAIKAEVVGQDETETGLRAILNYGHTFAHAIETLGGYGALTHGLAVALGMRVAARLAVLLKMFSPEEEALQNRLLDSLKMPSVFSIDPDKAWEVMALDKKVEQGSRAYILPDKIGSVRKVTNIDKKLLEEAWKSINPRSAAA